MPPPIEESSSDESIPARPARPAAKGGPLSLRSAAEKKKQREIAARVRVDEPLAPAPRVAGAQRATPCLPCVRSALGGRSAGSCFDVAGAPRANRCLLCSAGHRCLRLPSAVRAAARELVSLLEAEAPKKEIARARSTVRRLLKEHPEMLESEQPSEAEPSDEEEDDDDDDDEEEEEDEEPAGGAALRSERKEALKKGLCALVDLLFEE
ncbi:hypothetical protein SLS64_003440 [Diaporthe eres]